MTRVVAAITVVLLGFTATQLISSGTKGNKSIRYIVCVSYALGVLYFTLLSRRPSGDNRINLVLFYSLYRSLKYPIDFNDYVRYLLLGQYNKVFTTIKPLETALLNVLLFVPMGYLLPVQKDADKTGIRQVVVYSALCSLCIEIIQTVTNLGWFDVDDLFCNVVGGIIGFLFYRVAVDLRKKWRKQYEG